MITAMRGCVAHNDLWPISSRSFGLDLENRVRSVASTVLNEFFLYLAQMITIIRWCVACYIFFRIWKFEFLPNFWNFFALTLKKKSTVLDGFFPYLAQMITSMRGCVAYNYTPRFNEVERGVYWYHLVRLSVCLSVDRIVSALYLQQYSSDPFHICISYQATSEGVSRVMPVSKFKNFEVLANLLNL